MTAPLRHVGLLVALLCGAGPAYAQRVAFDVYAGRAIHETVSANIPATSLIAGLRVGSPQTRWLYAAAAAPLDDGTPVWGAAGATLRLPLALASLSARPRTPVRVEIGVDAGAHGYTFRDGNTDVTGSGVTFEGAPFLATSLGSFRGITSVGWRQHLSVLDGISESRRAFEAAARVESLGFVRVGAGVRWVRVEEGGYPAASADAGTLLGSIGITASVERWLADDLDDFGWSLSALMPAGAVDVWAALRQDTPDPLYTNTPRRSWNIGLTRRFGAPPRPAAVAPVRDGRSVIRLPRADAPGGVSVAGDFTDWQPRPMAAAGTQWELAIALPSGVYRYAFVDAAGRWFVPESVPGRMDDGMGGHVAVLIVP